MKLNSRRTRGCATSQTTLLAVALLTFMGAGVLWSVSGSILGKMHPKSPGKAPQHRAVQDRDTMAQGTPLVAPATQSVDGPLPAVLSAHHLVAAAKLPLAFEPNQGQADPRAAYISHGAGYGLFLTPGEAVLALGVGKAQAIHMQLEGASANPKIAGSEPLPGRTNYFRGNDSRRWVRNVPTFARVNYSDVYPGVDLVFYGKQGQLEYDFKVRSGADLRQIRLDLSGVDKVSLAKDGSLTLKSAAREVRWNKPVIYQEIDGSRREVAGGFHLLAQNRVGFTVGAYDRSRDLVIDPLLAYATYFGGAGDEVNPQVAVDANANIYLSGTTSSASLFPSEACGGTSQPTCATTLSGATDVFVSKLDSVGTSVIYTTYLNSLSIPAPTGLSPYGPATGADSSAGLAIDNQGDAYVTGTTTSGDFPVTPNAFQATPVNAQAHVFLTKLDPTGASLLYSSYLSGSNADAALAVAADNTGHAYILGTTQSVTPGDFPTGSSFQQQANGATNLFFVAKFDTTQTVPAQTLNFFSYLGGGTSSVAAAPADGVICAQLPCGGIALDTTGNAYIAIGTTFSNLPAVNAYQLSLHGTSDAYLAKIAANGSALLYATYLGGSGDDAANAISIDSSGNAYLTGSTTSTDFPAGTAKSFSALSGSQDAFVAKLNNPSTGALTLTFTSYLGGTGTETGNGIVADSSQGVYLVGSTDSADFPTFPTGTLAAKGTDAFIAKFNTNTTLASFVSSSLLGGTLTDRATSIAQNSNGALLVAGETNSTDFPVKASTSSAPPLLQSALNGTGSGSNRDAFLANFGPSTDLSLALTVAPNPVAIGSAATFTYTITNNGPDTSTGAVLTIPIPGSDVLGGTLGTFSSGSSSCTATGTSPNQVETCTLGTIASGSTASVSVGITPAVFTTGPSTGNPPASVGMSGHVSPGNTAVDPNGANDSSATVKTTVEYFTSAITPPSQSVAAGQTATYTVTITPNSNTGFPTNITLACVNPTTPVALTNTTCTFTPNPVTAITSTSGSATSVLKITTVKPTATASIRSRPNFWYAMWLPICGVALFGAGSSRRRRWASGLALVVLLGTIAWLPACGSKSTATTTTGTQPGTYSIGITATSGSYVYPPAASPKTISLTVTSN